MAATKVINLKVTLNTDGSIKKVTNNLEKLNKTAGKTAAVGKKVNKTSNELKRNLEGVSQRAGSTGKDFARMSQGMGGVVQAYATVAANVFALSAAFLVLRNAADLSSMTKSAEDFSNRFGVSVTRITKQMQEASGGALDFAEALPSINKAVSAGIGIDQMKQLTVAATKAAQTFGGSTTEALSRFISASQRGRVEIIQTLGVVIKTEQAYKDYAASVGKTALELTAFDRQQAILNATIEESNKVFDGITIDPNPFTQFASTLIDLKDTILSTMTDSITPFLNVLNKSIPAALLLMAVVLKSVLIKAFPLLTEGLAKVSKAGLASSRAVTTAMIKAKEKRLAILNSEVIQVAGLTKKQATSKLNLITNGHNKELRENKQFVEKLGKQDSAGFAVRLAALKAFWARADNLRKKGTILKGTQGLSDVAVTNARNLTASLGQGTFKAAAKNQAGLNTALAVSTSRVKEFGRSAAQAFNSVNLAIKSTSSALKSGFALSFGQAQTGLAGFKKALISTTSAYQIFGRNVISGNRTIGFSFLTLGKIVGRTAGLIAGAFTAVIGIIFTFVFWIGLLVIGFKALNDKFNKSAKRAKEIKETFASFSDTLKDITDRTENYISNIDRSTNSNASFIKSLEFLRGTLDSTISAFNEFDLNISKSMGGKGLSEAILSIKELGNNLEFLQDNVKKLENTPGVNPAALGIRLPEAGQNTVDNLREQLAAADRGVEIFTPKLRTMTEAMKTLATGVGPTVVENFISLNKLFNSQGIDKFQEKTIKALEGLDDLGVSSEIFITSLRAGDIETFTDAFQGLETAEQISLVFDALSGSIDIFGDSLLNAIKVQIGAGRSLQDLNTNIGTFVSGIDKLKAASIPNKEIVNFIIGAERAFTSLQKAAGVAGNLGKVTKDVIKGDDLEVLKQFFGIEVGDKLKEALAKVNVQLKIFRGLVEENIRKNNELKIITTQLGTLKLEEVRSDARRISIIQDTNKLLVAQAGLKINLVQNSIDLLKAELAIFEGTGEGDNARSETIRQDLIVLDATLKARQNEQRIIAASTKDLQEKLKIDREIVANANAILTAQKSVATINKKLATSTISFLAQSKKIFLIEKQRLQNNIKDLEIRKEQARLKLIGPALERALALEEQKLLVLEAQTRELERQQLSRIAREDETSGTTSFFTEQGIKETVGFFIREMQAGVNKLKSTFEIIGKGFADTLNSTFDGMVDSLLEGVWGEGGRDFGRAALEVLKEGLRETFGSALKARIQDSLNSLFIGLFNPKGEEVGKADPQLVATVSNTKALNELTKAMQSKDLTSDAVGITSGKNGDVFEGLFDNVLKTESPVLEGLLETLSGTAESTKDITEKGFLENIKLLGLQLIELVKAGIQAVGSFFFAKGGIAQGGFSSIPKLAAGAIATGPNLAVIGEGKNHEAVVPLPNNREIPVDLKGGGGGDTIMIEQSFDFRNADAGSIGVLRQEAKNIEDRTFNRVFSEINRGGRFAKISGRR